MKEPFKPQTASRRHERLKKSIGRKACLTFALLAVSLSQVPAQQVSDPAVPPADAKTVDAGDSYTADGHKLKLKRVTDQIVIKRRPGAAKFEPATTELAGVGSMRRAQSLRDNVVVWQDAAATTDEAGRLQNLLNAAKADPEVEYAFPVYLVEEHNLRLYGGDELVLQLQRGTSDEDFLQLLAEQGLKLLRPVPRLEKTYIARLVNPKNDDVLSAVSRLLNQPGIEWAEHHFLMEIRLQVTPSDPYLSSQQWHLAHSSGMGADSNANIKAPNAWTGSQPYGSPGVVVAVLDSGIQTNHPDLSGNILPGYDFFSGDNNPGPSIAADNHGTAMAGMIAAMADGNNSVGAAPNCRIISVRILEGPLFGANYATTIRDAVMWAADNADVLSCSWTVVPDTLITSAFNYATTSGRGGKGVVVAAAAGNSASKWMEIDDAVEVGIPVPSAGIWRFRFVMDNSYQPPKTSRAHLAYVRFPDGSVERFDSPGIPSGWTSVTPGTPWSTIDDLGKSHGVGRYFLASAQQLQDSEDSAVLTHQMTVNAPSRLKAMVFITNPDTAVGFAVESHRYLGNDLWETNAPFQKYGWANSLANTEIAYPASLTTTLAVGASSDWDYRADFSRYSGYTLDFLAPGGGGFKGIFTTDRTGNDGFNGFAGSLDYTVQVGTSLSAPLAASVAALVLSRNGHLTWTQIRDLMRNTAEKVKSSTVNYDANGYNAQFGYGRLHAGNAVAAVTVDSTAPLFSGAYVQTTRSIDLVFNEPMGGAIYTPSSFTISGAGKGTLANNPAQVIRLTPSKYRLVWNAGGMVLGSVTIATTGLKDVAGNALASPTSRDSTGTTAVELVNSGGSTVFPFGDLRTPWLQNSIGWVGNTPPFTYTTDGYQNYTTNPVNTSGVTSPAPTGVYQTARAMYYNTAWATYTLKNVLPNETVKVRLHFNEFYGWANQGDQLFHIRINNSNPGTYPNLPYYDIMNYTGVQMNKADIREFTITNGSGPMVIQLQPDQGWTGHYNWTLNGIEVVRP